MARFEKANSYPASQAKADVPRYGIYATSWKRERLVFPSAWARRSMNVAGANMISRYVKAKVEAEVPDPTRSKLGARLFRNKGGKRIIATVRVIDK